LAGASGRRSTSLALRYFTADATTIVVRVEFRAVEVAPEAGDRLLTASPRGPVSKLSK